MLRPFKLDDKVKLNAANFAVEGPTLMPHSALMKFLARCFLMLILSIVSQLPKAMSVKIDSDAFLGSIYYVDESGINRQVEPWKDGPGWRDCNRMLVDSDDTVHHADNAMSNLTDQQPHLVARWSLWLKHENKYGAHIPSAVCCLEKITPLEGWTQGQPLQKISPLLFNKGKVVTTDGNDAEGRAESSDSRSF